MANKVGKAFIKKIQALKNKDELLKRCAEIGYKHVSLSKEHPEVPESKWWASEDRGVRANDDRALFVVVAPKVDIDGWPAIWRISKDMEIGCGCCNSNQSQVRSGNKM